MTKPCSWPPGAGGSSSSCHGKQPRGEVPALCSWLLLWCLPGAGAQSTSRGPRSWYRAWRGLGTETQQVPTSSGPSLLLEGTQLFSRPAHTAQGGLLQGKELLRCHSSCLQERHGSLLPLPGTGLVVIQRCPHCHLLRSLVSSCSEVSVSGEAVW